jgi:ATPase subunit of ABC transporter with duplicated ATPase domains
MGELPGGRRLRVLLAQALFGNPDALLLDEPTNNLDIDSIRWLERFLQAYRGVLLTVSHDRHFLNEICTHIADIDYETIITYTGGYDEMVGAKGQIRGKIEQENVDRQKKIEQLQDFVARFGAGTRASQVQSRKRQIQRLTLNDLKRSNIERPFIQFQVKKPSSKQTLIIEGLTKRWPEITVCERFRAVITKGEKIAIIGRSGVGKTTLCKMLMEELKPDAGRIDWGTQASLGYLAQDHREGIADGMTVTEWLHSFDPNANLQDIRGLLGRMLFKGEEGTKPTEALSGGEAVRLIFSKLMLMKDNVLILDEPTNHLDLESIIALGDGLTKFEGTAFIVTHDRDLVAAFATRIFAFTDSGLVDWQGNYDDYLERHGSDEPTRGGSNPPRKRNSQRPMALPLTD